MRVLSLPTLPFCLPCRLNRSRVELFESRTLVLLLLPELDSPSGMRPRVLEEELAQVA